MFLGEASCATLLAHYLGQQGRQYVTLEKSPFLPGIQTFGSAPDVRKVDVKKKKKKATQMQLLACNIHIPTGTGHRILLTEIQF